MNKDDGGVLVLHIYNGVEWMNLTQMTIISATEGKNPLEEMEWPS